MAELNFNATLVGSDLLKKIEQIRDGIKSIAFEMDEQGKKVDSSFFKKVFNSLDGTEMLKNFVSSVISTRKEMQELDKVFKVLLGSKEKSESFVGEIKDYALSSSLSVSDISQAAQTLLRFNISAEEVIPTLKMLGDVSMGSSQQFSSLSMAFGQISAAGKLTSNHLSLLVSAGFNPLQTIAEQTGKSVSVLMNEMSEGNISAKMVTDSFVAVTSEGGKFHGVMESGAGRISESQNKLQDAIQDTLNEIGEQNEELIEGTYEAMTFLVQNYETIGRVIVSLVATYGTAKAALIVYDVIKAKDIALDYAKLVITGKLDMAMKALNLTMLKNPYVLLAALIVGAAMAMWTLADHTTAAERAQERYNKRVQEANDREQERKEKLKSLVSELEDETTAEARRVEILDMIKEQYPTFFKFMLDEKGHIRDLTEAWKAYNEETLKNKADDNEKTAIGLRGTIAEQKRFVKLLDMGTQGRRKAFEDSDSDKVIWNKYRMRTRFSVKKDIEDNELDLINVENDIMAYSFNQWKADLKKKTDKEIILILSELKRKAKAVKGNKHSTEAYAKRIDALQYESELRTPKTQTHDKAYWEDKTKITQSKLDKLSDEDAAGKKGKALKDEIAGYKEKIAAFSSDTADDNKGKEKREEQAENIREQQQYLNDLLENQSRELIRTTEDQWNGIWQARIDTMGEGGKKTLEQMEYNHEMELQTIDREKEDLLRINVEKAEAEFNARENLAVAEDPKHKRGTFDGSSITLSETENKQFDERYKIALTKQANDITNYYKSILEKYQDFSSQRVSVEKQYNDDIAYLQSQRTNDNAEEIDRAIQEAQEKMKDAKQQIDNTEVQKLEGSNSFLKKLYGDYSQMKFEDLGNLLEEAKQIQSYLSGDGNGDGLKFITKEQLALIKESPTGLANLKGALDKLLNGGKTNQWDDVFDNFSKGLSKLKGAKDIKDVSEAMQDIGGAASEASSMLSGVAGNLSQMFEEIGNTGAADAMNGVQDAMNAISNIGQGFAKGGIVGGIAAAVGEAANFIGKAFAATARHEKALREIMNEAIAQQRAYNLLLLEQNLLYEKGTTMFGVDIYGKAKNAVNVMKDAISELNKELEGSGKYKGGYINSFGFGRIDLLSEIQRELYNSNAGLADIQIKTGHKKTGLFGWGKGKDTYSSVLSEYPELIDQNGKFNTSLAETIINTRTMSDENRSAFQNIINLSKQAENALQTVKDYLTDIFGDLGNTMSDALVDAFKNGSDAAQAFTDSVSTMLESLAQQMVYSVTLAPVIEKAQKQMLDVMQNIELSDEEKFKQWTGILGNFVDDAVGEQNNANLLYEELKKTAAEKGFDIFESDKSSLQESTQKGFSTMSQEAGDELNGRFTALQISNEEIKNSMIFALGSLSSICTTASDRNILLTEMRNLALMSNGHLEDIAKYTKPLLGFGEKLDKIEQNTKNL